MQSRWGLRLRAIAALLAKLYRKLRQVLTEQGIGGLWHYVGRRLRSQAGARRRYQAWIKAHTLNSSETAQIQAEIQSWPEPPIISILLPVYNVEAVWLERAIASVQAQLYPHWQLCIADDASPAAHIRPLLERLQATDPRLQVVYRAQNGGISAASNEALAIATGEFIALLDHDDELSIDALYVVARHLRSHPDTDFIYSDEDKIDAAGQRFDPFFKPDWSPDYLYGCMYTGHLSVYRTELVRAIGGFRSEVDGAQDWDLALRVTAQTQRIQHIPQVLYHWRILPVSMASGTTAKPWAYEAARRSLQDCCDRSSYPGSVIPLAYPGFYRVQRQIQGQPKISIIIPTAGKVARTNHGDRCLLLNCLDSVRSRSTYPHIEIIVVDGYDVPAAVLAAIAAPDVQLVRCAEPFNFSQRINLGAAAATGEMLLLLNDDTEVITPDWLEALLEFAQQPEVGAVGAKLLFPNGRLQHGGVLMLDGVPAHVWYNGDANALVQFGSTLLARNYLAVTGACLMVRRDSFIAVGGLDEAFPLNYNDVDFCLRLRQAGYRTVWTPYAELIHYESVSRVTGLQPGELERLQARWPQFINPGSDPYYSPHFAGDRPDFTINPGS